jgi:membrane protein
LLKETWADFQKDEAGQLGAALSYYAMFSIFPLLILLVAVLGFVLRFWDPAVSIQGQILAVVEQNFSPNLREAIEGMLETVEAQAGAATGIGLVTLLLGASGVFQQLDTSFNKIWKVPDPPEAQGLLNTVKVAVTQKLFSFGMVLAVGFLLLVSLALTGVTQALLSGAKQLPLLGSLAENPAVSFIIGLVITLILNTLIFALLFKYLPDTRVRWGDVWLGALATALIWELAKRLLALYIGGSSYASAYGAIGTVLVLMAWIYFTSQVLFLGAEFTQVYSRRHGSRASQAQPAPAVAPQPAPRPTPPPAAQPGPSTGTVAAATGAGLLIGVIGGAIAGTAALIIGTRRAASSVTRRLRRTH